MSGTSGEERAVRLAEVALRGAIVVAVAALSFALFLRYRLPPHADAGWTADAHAATAPEEPAGELSVVTAATTVPESLAAAPDSAMHPVAAPPPATAAAITDVVLLPCSEPNPRPDGRYLIPPHDPTHRTVVGLPSRPGEPKRGLLILPHDPAVENRIPIQLVPLDSILEHTVRIPPHDPERYKLVRPDTLPCLGA